ncbi:hypothetical protein SSX86_025968 [Deinandra increscens subsp. villosa]|uniref:Protein kinase domain-containing protein n=1 Tax=Deinandra increscens subsp. villosa TaxID=3103831 RepID=A0AAP0CDM9_9ASTR
MMKTELARPVIGSEFIAPHKLNIMVNRSSGGHLDITDTNDTIMFTIRSDDTVFHRQRLLKDEHGKVIATPPTDAVLATAKGQSDEADVIDPTHGLNVVDKGVSDVADKIHATDRLDAVHDITKGGSDVADNIHATHGLHAAHAAIAELVSEVADNIDATHGLDVVTGLVGIPMSIFVIFFVHFPCFFRGPIPNSIGSLKKLVFLGLNNNSFTGSIPVSLGNLTNLSWLDLSDNRLTGPIPVSNETSPGLDKLVKAKHIHLSNNQLSGPIQSQLFHTNMSLIHVIVNNNQLSGTIPSSIGSVKTLEVIRLDSNSLTGTVPQNLSNLITLSELYLSNNNLSGPIPDLLGMNSLFYVDMSNNSFDKSDIPTWFTLLSLNTMVLSNNDLNGTLDIGNRYSSNLIVDLTNNSITNFAQSSIYNLSLIVDNNPICEAGSTGRYCAAQNPNIPNTLPSNTCPPINCGSFKVLSPNCKSFQSRQLPVDSISLNNATVDEYKYLQYRLYIFPSSQEYFDRSSVSTIGTVINRQNFSLPFYGPMFFLDESYCCFPGNKSSNHGVVIGAVVGGLVAVLLIVLAITYGIYQKRQAKKTNQNSPFANWGLDNGSDAGSAPQLKGPRWCSFEELKRCTNNFSEDNIIGSGGFGKVYKGTLETGEVVAIKRAKQESLQGAKEFKTEIELLSRIHHKNVVALVGFCYEQGEQMLVYEHISNGTLKYNLSVASELMVDMYSLDKSANTIVVGIDHGWPSSHPMMHPCESEDTFIVTVYPNVDYAFVVAFIAIVDAIKNPELGGVLGAATLLL